MVLSPSLTSNRCSNFNFGCGEQDGKLEAHEKSDEIPETNDEPVKVVVRKSLNDMVLESGKNGMCSEFFCFCFSHTTMKLSSSPLPCSCWVRQKVDCQI